MGDQCPLCDFPLDARKPDPPPEFLRAVIGDVVAKVGDVRIVRTILPDCGCLYETTNGIFFLPHRLSQVRLVRDRSKAALKNLRGPDKDLTKGIEIAEERPRVLLPTDSHRLPDYLMRNPGVFFVARRSIKAIHYSLWGWTIRRPNGLVLRLRPLEDHDRFQQRMGMLAEAIGEVVCS
jgi:hypothetical protein